MDPKQIRSQVVDVYNRTVGKSVDSKTLTYIVSTIVKGENTLPNITKTLVNTTEYKERMRSTFAIAFYDAVGKSPTSDVPFEAFWEQADKTNVIDHADIERFVRGTNEYKDKYCAIIGNLVSKHCPDAVSDEDLIAECLKKLESVEVYDVAHMEAYIKARAQSYKAAGAAPAPLTIVESSASPQLDAPRLTAFEAAFGRQMFVQEYFKYIVEPSPTERASMFNDLQTLLTNHTSNFNRMAQLYMSYCNIELTEHEYATKHLFNTDMPSYFDDIIDTIVQTPEYQICMKAILQQYYKKLFELQMDTSDLDYIFQKVKSHKLHLKSEKIVETLKAFKHETDAFIENIFSTYQRVLERQPDAVEIEETIADYRTKSRTLNIESINAQLAIVLSKTLEFHDIVKKHIKVAYNEATQENISPSRLYATLQTIVQQNDVTIDNLEHKIKLALA